MKATHALNKEELAYVELEGEYFFKIAESDKLRPFFMSIVSDSNHWMFISSNGGLSAGRKNAEYALFPYYTDDKITESAEITGSKTILRVELEGETHIWEPFSSRFAGKYQITRNLYKNRYGNKILFEEENHELNLIFGYSWNSSDVYGFVRKASIISNSSYKLAISVLDGIQNIIPYGVPSDLQNRVSNLVDAYKRSELESATGLGIFALSAIIVDKAEPSEALKANVAWCLGLDNPRYLLSSKQLADFRQGRNISSEHDIKAEKGAYFVQGDFSLFPSEQKSWMIVANVNQNHAGVARLSKQIREDNNLAQKVLDSVEEGTRRLIALNASADGLQCTSDRLRDTRHFSNVLFNIMRGGIFDFNYQIDKNDLLHYLENANKESYEQSASMIRELPATFGHERLQEIALKSEDGNFRRLCLEYLPLTFSRRHGDPSRPWNKFSINTRSEIDGSKILDYEGNWRDIFQNWEALSFAFPDFVESMIHKFLNATTFDGYNPYRVTKGGFDWEIIEPDDPWSYIGYWGDHQIIYLLKFLEFLEDYDPGKLTGLFDKDFFVYANVPYTIKPYEEILKNSKDTIDFNHEEDAKIREQVAALGADGALIRNQQGGIHAVNFIEKMLATTLAKLSNFIPEAGIWMNTQRPEWNDANNALVGNGVSMVTLYYLRRFLKFFENLFANISLEQVQVSEEILDFFGRLLNAFEQHEGSFDGNIDDTARKALLDQIGQAASDYRVGIYAKSFSGNKPVVSVADLKRFITLSLKHLEHSIDANKREDGLYHAYNLMTVEEDNSVSVAYLSEMLEGQVAVLSAGYLSSEEALSVLDGLKHSALFRDDQYSYLLYPNKNLPAFFEKNNIPEAAVQGSSLLSKLVEDGNTQILEKDINGVYHFNGNFRNANDLAAGLDNIAKAGYAALVAEERKQVLGVFEAIFNHKAFTGRSGTFFGYEGLGSIYWHMVSKLLLAVEECCLKAIEEGASAETVGKLLEHFYEINEGIGVHKPPSLYGAFPTDPYSHTPAGKGAQQPGMTGQVKEDIIARFGELGVFVKHGRLLFQPSLLRKEEFLTEAVDFNYFDVTGEAKQISLEAGTLCFTWCQVPVIYHIADEERIEVARGGHAVEEVRGLYLSEEASKAVFGRRGDVVQIDVYINEHRLK
jgi:hypothetical protein